MFAWVWGTGQFIPASAGEHAHPGKTSACWPAWRRQLGLELHEVLLLGRRFAALALPKATAGN